MKEIKIGRITLSFIFISLGIVMLLEKFVDYALLNIVSVFWPVILVFFGLEIIYSSFYIKLDKERSRKIDIPSISIIFMFVIILGTSNIPKTNIQHTNRGDISEEIIIKKSKKIIIDDSNIDIFVKKSGDEKIKVRLEGFYKYNNRDNLKNEEMLIKEDNKGQITKITSNTDRVNKNIKKMGLKDMKYLVEVPKNIELEVINNYGEIYIEDINNNVTINSNYGDVNLEDVKGAVFIKSNNGDILIDSNSIKNNIDIYCDYGDVSMKLPKKQSGKFNMITTYGNIYDELEFNIIESASTSSINEMRKRLRPNFNIRVNNGDIIVEAN